jgi:hypothetical protein
MKFWSKRRSKQVTLAVAGIAFGWVVGGGLSNRAEAQAPAAGQKAPAAKGATPPAATGAAKVTAGAYFKNVTTSTLKELTPDDFLSAMGVMADSLGLDCADCHPGAGSDKVDWVIDTPAKKTARKMVEMVAGINKSYFAGSTTLTCYTCHHAKERPITTVSLDDLYAAPSPSHEDMVTQDKSQPLPAVVLDKYIAALGGAQKLNTLTSFVATGSSVGYEGLGGDAQFAIYAKMPDMRSTIISYKQTDRPSSIWSFDGKEAWVATPRGLLGEFQLEGGNLAGTRLEGQLGFPGQIKSLFTNWRTGSMESIGDNDYIVVQGSRGPLVLTLYFDPKTYLLKRMLRYTASPIGRVPTLTDYADYRDVGGIKFPFEYTFLWLDGRYTAKITDVKTNVAIDPKKFAKP